MSKILIVDDVEANRDLLADMLNGEYELDTAANGEEAIEKLKSGTDYSLILLDIQMPVVDGYGVMDYMNETGLFLVTPVIIISTISEADSRCFDYDVADYIEKPYKEKVVLRRIANVIKLYEYQKLLEEYAAKKLSEEK